MTDRAAIPELTAIRGLAAWCVVFHHFREYTPSFLPAAARTFFDHGYLAVDLFFVMSGYIMMHVHAGDFSTLEMPQWHRFLAKRFARIYPLHALLLVLYFSVVGALWLRDPNGISNRFSVGTFAVQLLLGQAFTGQWGLYTWNVPAWSLSVEWAAYMLFPVAAWLIGRARSPWRLSAACVGLWLLLGGVLYLRGIPDLNGAVKETLLRGVTQFLVGSCVYVLHRTNGWRTGQMLLLGVPTFLLTYLLLGRAALLLTLPPIAFTVVTVAIQSGEVTPLSWLLRRPFLIALGEWSFATYMVHYFIRDWLKALSGRGAAGDWLFPVFLLLVLIASYFVHRYYEVPARRWVLGRLLGGRNEREKARSSHAT